MLTSLQLKNFQSHEDLSLTFTAGLQVVRGGNEAGKSTLFRAVAYAWWGARALPQSLEETVTWGKPVGSLKVTVTFLHGGVEYTATRSKSGASLVSSISRSEGHSEVTAAMERLFGASAAVAQATMLARQKSLEDGLESGAVSLIEKLANMKLLDELILKIQDRLPSGNTKVLESQIAGLVTEAPKLDETPFLQRLQAANLAAAQLVSRRLVVQEQSDANAALAASALKKAEANRLAEVERVRLEKARNGCVVVQISDVLEDLDALRQKAEQQKTDREILANLVLFDNLSTRYNELRLSQKESELVTESQRLVDERHKVLTEAANCRTDRAVALSSTIKEVMCGFCGKDLSSVEEVQKKNAEAQAKADAAGAKEVELNRTAAALLAKHEEIQKALRASQEQRQALVSSKFIAVGNDCCPPRLTWTGPEHPPHTDSTDYSAALKRAEAVHMRHANTVKANEAAAARRAVYESELAKLTAQVVTDEEAAALEAMLSLQVESAQIGREMEDARKEEHAALAALETAKAVQVARADAWRVAQEQKQKLEELLVTTRFHNSLIGKLRDARPAVAKELWSLVLAGVSHYFSAIRGTVSTVTRSTEGFMIDGKPVVAFSGSTKDCLGIANRLMLQKTFLPNVSLMLIDEPGAAFDEVREAELLGVLAGAGLEQVILVTHSQLADSFAANVIWL